MDEIRRSDVLFHPPGSDPFPNPSVPAAFYHPSNSQPKFDGSKIVLTPEKRKRFEVKDNESYSALNYSFSGVDEEDIAGDKSESEISNTQSHSQEADTIRSILDEAWSSRSSHSSLPKQEDSHTSVKVRKTRSTTSSQIDSLTERTPSPNLSIPSLPPKTPTPEMSSTQDSTSRSSNISVLLDRFRHGKPRPRSERKHHDKPPVVYSKPPISVDRRQYDWKDEHTEKSGFDSTKSATETEFDNVVDEDSFMELQRRVDQILLQSESSPKKASGQKQDLSPMPPKEYSTFGGSSGTHSTLDSSYRTPIPQQQSKSKQDCSRMADFRMPHSTSVDKPNSVSDQHPSYNPPTSPTSSDLGKDDILHQWRLRRKMEMARKEPHTFGYSCPRTYSHQQYFPAERPFAHETPNLQHQLPYGGPTSQQPFDPDPSFQQQSPDTGPTTQQPFYSGPVNQPQYLPGPVTNQQPPYPPQPMLAPHQIAPVGQYQPCQQQMPCSLAANQKYPNSGAQRGGLGPLADPLPQRSVLVTTIDTTCAETQTTPKSSRSSLTFQTQLEMRESPIALRRVTIVDASKSRKHETKSSGTASSPESVRTSASSARSEEKSDAPKSKRKPRGKPKQQQPSPTTTVVKKVIGSRLFDTSSTSTPQKLDITDETTVKSHTTGVSDVEHKSFNMVQSSDDSNTFCDHKSDESSSIYTQESNVKPPSEGSQQFEEPGDYLDVLQQLLASIESEETDFQDDPVLTSLRSQREALISQLSAIEQKLNRADQPTS